MKSKHLLLLAAVLCGWFTVTHPACAQGTAFTYQGRLTLSGTNYTGSAEFQPTLWAVDTGGAALAAHSPATLVVGVTNGLFVLPLDFGANFPGANRWLQLEVRTTLGAFTTLAPRQPLTATPYAITAAGISGALPAAQISGVLPSAQLGGAYSGAVTFNNGANSFTGNGGGLTNVNAASLGGLSSSNFWKTGGNAGTTPGAQFLGTADNQPLEFKVNNTRAMRFEPNTNGSPNVIGGAPINFAAPGVVGATIGGGAANYGGFSYTNSVSADFGVIGGGVQNTIQSGATISTIGGGYFNTIQPNASGSTIGGGNNHTIQTGAHHSTIGGGEQNTIQNNATYSTIGGGVQNTIQTSARFSTIGGGEQNTIQTNAFDSTIGGGVQNTIQTSARYSTIGGGGGNTIQPDALYATIPGGQLNSATNYAFAAGLRAKANHTGAFVWADSQNADFASTANNQFLIRAAGGVGIGTTAPGKLLQVGDPTVESEGMMRFSSHSNSAVRTWDIGVPKADVSTIGYSFVIDDVALGSGPEFIVQWGTGRVGIGVNNPQSALHVAGTVTATAFNPSSDRNLKENFTPVSPREVLAKVAALPISRWNFIGDAVAPHVGPMAQDFRAAFGLGTDDKHIATVDADGVALAAIQGLNQKLEEQRAENAALKQRLEKLEQLMNGNNGGAQ